MCWYVEVVGNQMDKPENIISVCKNENLRSLGHRRWLKGPSNCRPGDFLKMPPPQLSS